MNKQPTKITDVEYTAKDLEKIFAKVFPDLAQAELDETFKYLPNLTLPRKLDMLAIQLYLEPTSGRLTDLQHRKLRAALHDLQSKAQFQFAK